VAEHRSLLEGQGGRCAICRERPPTDTDHDHLTGVVRGLLCNACNLGLGQFRDDPGLLLAAAEYLAKNREREPSRSKQIVVEMFPSRGPVVFEVAGYRHTA
jgi:hypothetical protein